MMYKMSLKQRRSLAGFLFILPWLIGIFVFVARPMIQSITFAFGDLQMFPWGRELEFVGFSNFAEVWLRDTHFVLSLYGFIIETAIRVPVIVVIALLIAILVNQKIKFKGIFRTIYFLPVIIASGPVLSQLMGDATSIQMINSFQIHMFLSQFIPTWMVEPVVGLFDEIILILWFSGIQILIFLAALQKISPSLYEAAKIDGGSGWECFWKITLPTIKPVVLVNLVYTLVTLANSSNNNLIEYIMLNIFDGRRGFGFASAMAWMYALVISIMLVVISLFFVKREDKKIRVIKKMQKKERKSYNRTRRTINRNEIKMARKLNKTSSKGGEANEI